MNYETAKKVLDQIKDGSIYPQWVINTALYLTGDLEFDEIERLKNETNQAVTKSRNIETDVFL